jgi:hypothetical protein
MGGRCLQLDAGTGDAEELLKCNLVNTQAGGAAPSPPSCNYRPIDLFCMRQNEGKAAGELR